MKTAIITGVSRGIGEATAQKFINEGYRVIGSSKTGKIPFQHPKLEIYQIDLSNSLSIQNFVVQLKLNPEKVDVLINNAGILIDKGSGLNMDILRKTLEVNLFGLIDLTEQLLPFINKGGHIINLSSGLGSLTDAQSGHYAAYRISKAAVNMYTRTLAAHSNTRGIKVSSIDPGWVKTEMGGTGATRDPSEPANEIYQLAVSEVESGFFWYKGRKKNW